MMTRSLRYLLPALMASSSSSLSVASNLKAEWTDLKDAARIVPKRSGHVSFTAGCDNNNRLLVFGGYVEEEGEDNKKRYVTNDLWEWKRPDGWEQVASTSVSAPGPRLASAVASIGDTPYMMGGWDPQTEGTGGIILDTVHKLNDNNEWSLLEDVTLPGGSASRHVCLSLKANDKILFHNHRCTDCVHLFDGTKFQKQPVTGTAPNPRGLHSACMLSDTKALFFAGAAQDGEMSNEVFVLDTETWKWTAVQIEGPSPSPRASPCLSRYSDNCAICFGGAGKGGMGLIGHQDTWSLHLDDDDHATGTWQLLSETGPPPRNAATLDLISSDNDGSNAKEYLLTGGWTPFVETHGDCFVLKISEE